ncbi:MAG: hypothetical protein LBL39_01250 [Planctomycetaceae bacterium]|jgi:hypothetical protein|nr:hypothetical protein [Planctomycetaceae bacterium]
MTKMAMLGPTGVGKTSLLAAMYPQLEEHFPGDGYQLVPEEQTRLVLDNLRQKLANLGSGGGASVADMQVEGTKNLQEFNFDLKYANETVADLSLQIFDMPGAYCTENGGAEAIKILNGSDVSFWCIDCVALMEKSGRLNDTINQPAAITSVLKKANLNPNHTLCIVLMRSETYEQSKCFEELKTQVKSAFGDYFTDDIKSIKQIRKVFYCSVQTTGNLRYSYHDKEQAVFIKHAELEYSPKNCECPVLCALDRSIEEAVFQTLNKMEEISVKYPIVRYFLNSFNSEYAKCVRLRKRLEFARGKIAFYLSEKDKRFFEWK